MRRANAAALMDIRGLAIDDLKHGAFNVHWSCTTSLNPFQQER
ncbi:MAG: hypothetical protein OYK82_06090 [Gammaproteobacteria bacterium]|nr:hypothetical protein [Gammaproteobacteria bacterium]